MGKRVGVGRQDGTWAEGNRETERQELPHSRTHTPLSLLPSHSLSLSLSLPTLSFPFTFHFSAFFPSPHPFSAPPFILSDLCLHIPLLSFPPLSHRNTARPQQAQHNMAALRAMLQLRPGSTTENINQSNSLLSALSTVSSASTSTSTSPTHNTARQLQAAAVIASKRPVAQSRNLGLHSGAASGNLGKFICEHKAWSPTIYNPKSHEQIPHFEPSNVLLIDPQGWG